MFGETLRRSSATRRGTRRAATSVALLATAVVVGACGSGTTGSRLGLAARSVDGQPRLPRQPDACARRSIGVRRASSRGRCPKAPPSKRPRSARDPPRARRSSAARSTPRSSARARRSTPSSRPRARCSSSPEPLRAVRGWSSASPSPMATSRRISPARRSPRPSSATRRTSRCALGSRPRGSPPASTAAAR